MNEIVKQLIYQTTNLFQWGFVMGILLVCHELNRKSPSVIVIKPPQDSNASSNWVLSLSKQTKKKTTLSSDTSKTNCFFFFLNGIWHIDAARFSTCWAVYKLPTRHLRSIRQSTQPKKTCFSWRICCIPLFVCHNNISLVGGAMIILKNISQWVNGKDHPIYYGK